MQPGRSCLPLSRAALLICAGEMLTPNCGIVEKGLQGSGVGGRTSSEVRMTGAAVGGHLILPYIPFTSQNATESLSKEISTSLGRSESPCHSRRWRFARYPHPPKSAISPCRVQRSPGEGGGGGAVTK